MLIVLNLLNLLVCFNVLKNTRACWRIRVATPKFSMFHHFSMIGNCVNFPMSSVTLENCDSHLILSTLKIPDTVTIQIMYPMHYLGQHPRNPLTDSFPLDPTLIGSLKNIRTVSYSVDETAAILFLKNSQGKKLVHVEQRHKAPVLGLFCCWARADWLFNAPFHNLFSLDQAVGFLGSLTTLKLDLRGLPNDSTRGSSLSFWLTFFQSTLLLEVLHASFSFLPAMLDGLNPSNKGSSAHHSGRCSWTFVLTHLT